MQRLLLFIFISLAGLSYSFAQSGEIQGKVTDSQSEETVPFANVTITVNGNLTGAQTDFDGYYSIKPVPPGSYEVQISYVGYQKKIVEDVLVSADEITFLDIQINPESELLEAVEIEAYKVPLLKKDETSTGSTVTKEDIQNMPTRNVQSIAARSTGVFQADEGGGLNVKGSRSESTDYYIDGIKVRGSTNLPASAIEQMSVVTGGVAARYGDATGGIINITTRGPSPQFAGGVEAITSRFLDPYNYNLVNGVVTGPLIKTTNSAGTKRAIAGFFLSGEARFEEDRDPSAIGVWHIKDDVLAELKERPLIRTESSTGFLKAADFVTEEDMVLDKVKDNVGQTVYSVAGKIDIQPASNINLTLGGTFNHDNRNLTSRLYELFNAEHRPQFIDNTYRVYGRFVQRFGSNKAFDEEQATASVLQNAYYQVQFDYSKSTRATQDPIFEDRLFDYGYVGKFNTSRAPVYTRGSVGNVTGWEFQGFQDTLVTFDPGPEESWVNPEKVKHNLQYFEFAGDNRNTYYRNLDQIFLQGGLLNGSVPASLSSVYSMWYVPGRPYGAFSDFQGDQYRLTFRGSFDLKRPGASDISKHALEFGFEYEQRIDRYHVTYPQNLWNLMDQSIAQFGDEIVRDLDNPILVIDGEEIPFSEYTGVKPVFNLHDTIKYNLVRAGEQSFFDKSFRQRFGYGDLDIIDVYSVDKDQLSLDLFSPDELFNNGNEYVYYYGYDYLGNKLSTQPAFEDFWTETDDVNGFKSRPIGAFRPIYMAGYLQDKFSFKDLIFNVGVRVDRFDANQKVPKDQFVPLYGTRKVGDVSSINGNAVSHPGAVGDDYVVYVDDEVNPTSILGYRDGDQWYSSTGVAITDPDVLLEGGNIKPYLSNPLTDNPQDDIKNENYDPSLAFEDYQPQVTVMPRVAFSFAISEEAIFFAHYDVLSQRPQGRIVATPYDYYYFIEQATTTKNNPNLKPERTIDYQIGFKQKLTSSSSLTLSGFYRELKDMVQIINVPFAYPTSYSTFGNVDFGTVKGMEIGYDLRRTGNVRLTAGYTLQFADGTGSADASQASLIDFGVPNLRTIFPLDFDARHMLNMNFDFRFASGGAYNGPKLFGQDILSNTGLNIIVTSRSGTPYSRQAAPTPTAQFGVRTSSELDGSLNGSRLPWSFRVDARLEKDIKFGKSANPRVVNVYLLCQNLLNTQNVINVYSFTGNPLDDGFLTSVEGREIVEAQTDVEAFEDQYTVKVQNPNNYSIPRRLRLGLQFNF